MSKERRVERLGLVYLVNQLEAEHICVASPEFDSGIDFIAYISKDTTHFHAVPVQLKASTKNGFYTNQKYLQIMGLKIVYLWNVSDNLAQIKAFSLPYTEAEDIVDVQNRSRKDGVYFTQSSRRLFQALQQYEVTTWRKALFGMG